MEERQEQEQEQEEPDEFKREKYSREDETFRAWELAALGTPPSDKVRSGHAWMHRDTCM